MSGDNSYQHKFRLRGNYEIELNLPEDLNMKDVHRLTQWLQTLPFDNRNTRDVPEPRVRAEEGPTGSAAHGSGV